MRLFTVFLVCAGATTTLASSVHATVVADGRYALYTGSADGTEIDYIGEGAGGSDGSAAPPKFYFEIQDQRYIYIAVWATPAAARGILAEFLFNDLPVFSGDPAWQVYRVAGDPLVGAASPSTSILSEHIRRANRRFGWLKAAVRGGNAAGSRRLIEAISEDAAWMGPPTEVLTGDAGPTPTGPDAVWLIFRLSPNEIWPEIALWHSHNVGTGPLSSRNYGATGPYRLGGSGGAGGGSSYPPSLRGRGDVYRVRNPFPNTAPPNSSSVPPTVTPREPSNPVVPPLPPMPPERPRPPVPHPPIPEPTTAMLMLAGVGWLRRR